MIENEYKYPIYEFKISWSQESEEYPTSSTGWSAMYKDDKYIEELIRWAETEWWPNYIEEERSSGLPTIKSLNPINLKVEVKFLEYETWNLTWFSHMTYNIHLSDNDLLRSFEEFLNRKRIMNKENGHFVNDYYEGEHWSNNPESNLQYHCDMGALDRWRWKSPCRCEHCIKRGITRIDH